MAGICGNLESPKPNDIVEYGSISVEGWVFSINSKIKHVEVKINSKKYNTITNVLRKDVVKHHFSHKEKCEYSGFRIKIKIPKSMSKKAININVTAVAEDGEVLILGKFAVHQNFLNLYEKWCLKNTMNERKINMINEDIANFKSTPKISIVMPVYNTEEKFLIEAIESVKSQIYTNWELCIVDDNSTNPNIRLILDRYRDENDKINVNYLMNNSHISVTSNEAARMVTGEYIVLLDHDDLLTKDALYEIAKIIIKYDADIIYSDDDKIDLNGRRYDPQFKPDWSPELLLSYMYFSHLFCFKKELFKKVGGFRKGFEGSQDYDLALRMTEMSDKVYHISKILYHWRATRNSVANSTNTKPYSIINGLKAVKEAVKRRKIEAVVDVPDYAKKSMLGIYKLNKKSKKQPKISIIIPIRNEKSLLQKCINSIRNKSTYKNYEIIVVDNNSDDINTINYLKNCGCKVIKVKGINGEFNFSKLINEGVKSCKSEIMIFLNNDIEVISPNWIEELLLYMNISGIGAVGAKLLYPNNRVQHAGVVLKMQNNIAGHAFKLIPHWHGGYLGYSNVVRNYSAVTAACMMTKRSLFNEVSGFDEKNLKVAYNDLDYCMKLREKGYRIVYNPYAKLYHYEGKSRGVQQMGVYDNPKEEWYAYEKWCKYDDKYYNRNLSLEDELFKINPNIIGEISINKNIRVLAVSHNLNFEGAPLVLFNICKYLKGKNYDFKILSPIDGPLRKEYEEIGIECIIYNGNIYNFSNYHSYRNNLKKIAVDLKLKDYDIIYGNTILNFWTVEIGKILNKPTVWGIHESIDYRRFFASYSDYLSKCAIQNFKDANKVIFVADATQKLYKDLNTGNFKVIRNALDEFIINRYKQNHSPSKLREEFNIQKDEIVVTIVGTTCHRKGQKIFLEAANKIINENIGKRISFYIVGGRKSLPYFQELKNYIKENNIESSTQIIMECEDVFKYYMISDIFVCASYQESAPMVILEAMAFKVPIVSTNVFGIPEMIRNKREALLIEPGNSNVLAEKIKEIISDKQMRDNLVHNAYYRYLREFNIEKFADEYDKCFKTAFFEGGKSNIT